MGAHVECSGTVPVPMPEGEAFPLFTPEGERRWVSGWSPFYPAGGRPPPEVGLVFTLEKDEGVATWMVTRFDPARHAASYAYVLPGHRATLIDVDVEAAPGGGSRARVSYRMTSLAPGGDAFVRAFGDGYEAFLAGWGEAIRRHVVEGEPLDAS